MLFEDARIGEIAFNRERPLAAAACATTNGVRHARARAAAVHGSGSRVHDFPYGTCRTTSTSRPTAGCLSASMSEVNGDQFLRVWDIDEAARPATSKPLSEFKFGQSVPESFVFSPDGRYLYGSSYYTGVSNIFRYEVATGDDRSGHRTPRSGYFRPLPLADGRLVVLNYTERGFVPAIIEPRAAQGRQRDQLSRRRGRREASGGDDLAGAAAEHGRRGEARSSQRGAYDPLKDIGARRAPIRSCRATRTTSGVGYRAQLRGSAALRQPQRHRGLSRRASSLAIGRARPHRRQVHATSAGARELGWNRSDFYDLFGPTNRSRKGFAAIGGYDHLFIYDEPRKLELKTEIALLRQARHPAAAQNVDATFDALVQFKSGLYYTDTRRSLGAVDEEKGWLWNLIVGTNHAGSNTVPAGARRPRLRLRPAARAFLAVAAQRRGRRRRRPHRSATPTSISAASATTTSIAATSSATASTTRSRASRSTRSPAAASRAACSSGTCRPRCSSRSARPPSTSSGCARRCSPLQLWTDPAKSERARALQRPSARSST